MESRRSPGGPPLGDLADLQQLGQFGDTHRTVPVQLEHQALTALHLRHGRCVSRVSLPDQVVVQTKVELDAPALPLAVTVTVLVPRPEAVPEMTPVVALMLRPAGRPLAW
jgi:hypothetical protein